MDDAGIDYAVILMNAIQRVDSDLAGVGLSSDSGSLTSIVISGRQLEPW
jgi:hypothetical protein